MAPVDTSMSRRSLGRLGAAAATVAALGAVEAPPRAPRRSAQAAAPAGGTIKVGILHSLSGTMAISETTLKDVMLMLIEQQNAKGGLLGKKLEAGGGRSRLQLAAVRRKGAAAAVGGQVRRGVRLLDLGVAQVGAAGVRGAERHPVLSGAVRRPGVQPQRVLHRRGAEPAGDPGGRLPDEREQGEALGAGRHRLRLSAHHQPDSGSLSEAEGRRRRTTS